MDNLTHSLVGLAAAKAGLERVSPFATTLCVLAANSPDADVAIGFFADRWTLLHHHRGITHSIVGTLVLGILLPTIFYLAERVISRFRKRPPRLRLLPLVTVSVIVTATHPLLDWTNNYGVRPLLPFDGRWYYGDLVFVIDPYLWLVLGGAVFLLTSNHRLKIAGWLLLSLAITGLMFSGSAGRAAAGINLWPLRLIWLFGVSGFVAARLLKVDERFGRKIAVAALGFVVVYWGGLAVAHHFAYQKAVVSAGMITGPANERVIEMAAMPTLADPRRWLCVAETDQAIYRFFVNLGQPVSQVDSPWPAGDPYRVPSMPAVQRFPKPTGVAEDLVETASRDRRAQIFLNFARFPIAKPLEENCLSQTLVQFADVRYTEPGAKRGSFSLDLTIDCPAP